MKKHIIMHSLTLLTLLMSSIYAMEREDWQKTPGQRLGGAEQQSPRTSPTKRPSSPPRRSTTPPASAAPSAPTVGLASEAGRIPMTLGTGAPTTVSSTPPAGFVRHGPRQPGGAQPPVETDLRGTKIGSAAGLTTAAATAPLTPGSIDIQSSISERPHIINPQATQYSRTLQTMLGVSEVAENVITIPNVFTDDQLYLISEILNFMAQHMKEAEALPPQQVMIDFIRNRTNNFERISFIDALAIINFMDIPVAFDAITAIHQPLPLPRNRVEVVHYNQQLSSIAQLIRETRDNRLWQLLGSMLYPECLQYRECAEIVATIPPEMEHIVLGGYMQSHPQLYDHEIRMFNGLAGEIHSVVFSPDGKKLATRSEKGIIRLWNLANQSSRELAQKTTAIALSPDGTMFAAGSYDGIRLLNLKDNSSRKLVGYTKWVTSVAFSPDGTMLASVSDDGIRLLNLKDDSSRKLVGHTKRITSVAFSPDGTMLAAVDFIRSAISDRVESTILLWNLTNGSFRKLFQHEKEVTSIVFSPDGTMLALGSEDGIIRLLNLKDDSLKELTGHNREIYQVDFSPNGKIIISGSGDRSIRLWYLIDGSYKPIGMISVHEKPYSNVFNPDGTIIAAGFMFGAIRLWGYLSLREALQVPIATTSGVEAPSTTDGSSAAPSAPHRSVAEPTEEEAVILADPRFDQMGRLITPAQEQQPAAATVKQQPAATAAPTVIAPAAAPQPAPRKGIFGTISNWWYGKKR